MIGPPGVSARRILAAAATVVLCAGAAAGCGGSPPAPATLDEALGRFRLAFEEADASRLDGLYPTGWSLVSFSGEPRRSATGAELRQGLARLFRERIPLAWEERAGSIRRSPDGDYALFVPEWTSIAIGADRRVVEFFRIGLERARPDGAEDGSAPRWQIREFTAWTR